LFYRRLLNNHVLANVTFALVLALGIASYLMLPRQQDPTVNFNWIDITTILPGATARDIEKRVTDPLERALESISDVKFVSSTSREGISSILVRFEDISDAEFAERVADLRREIRSAEDEIPDDAEEPNITEITTANAFPTATVIVTTPGDGEQLRRQAQTTLEDLERMPGVDQVLATGLSDPELHVRFDPAAVEAHGLAPGDLVDTVRGYARDLAAGGIEVGDQGWLVSITGTSGDPADLGSIPVETRNDEVPLDRVATVGRGRSENTESVRYRGQPAVMLGVNKEGQANTLTLVDRINAYVDERNALSDNNGARLIVADDRTEITREALSIMQTNLLIGLGLVLVVAWLFLGTGISLLTAIGIPFILAGTFWVLWGLDQTLNVTVLLGVVIALGMLVDDAVVVVESIYYRMERGAAALDAAIDGIREVGTPVVTAVATTIAAFLPLMLLPGILGKFMFIVPLVVTTALLISLIEAFWMLPAHVAAARIDLNRPSRVQRLRRRVLRRIRSLYTGLLARVMRAPGRMLVIAVVLVGLAGAAVATETGIRRDFFASDPIRLFYVNIEMPVGTPLANTLEQTREVEERIRSGVREGEVRAIVSYAGRQYTDTSPRRGEHYGQVLVALNPDDGGLRDVNTMIRELRPRVASLPGPESVTFLEISGGPPTTNPISVKVRGDDFDNLRAAVEDLKALMEQNDAIRDISDDDTSGQMTLDVDVDARAARRAGVSAARVSRTVKLMVDGEIATAFQDAGEEREIRVFADRDGGLRSIDEVLEIALPTPDGGQVPLRELVDVERTPGLASINHYDFRRTITVEANLDNTQMDTIEANDWIREEWEDIRSRHPDVSLDFSGLLDDIQDSLDSMAILFLFGLGLMYLILGTQFRSYFQPLMILVTVPMAFTGVTAGLIATGNPLSLFTMYGIIALAGIAVNAAIVLVSAANERLDRGMSLAHATLFAARRRVIPILITSTTTVAGLFSLAVGLGGESLLWGPVATAIVWGLVVSTILTLFVVPTLYGMSMKRSWRVRQS
jgi:multidrug efflux pump subunit AcrB